MLASRARVTGGSELDMSGLSRSAGYHSDRNPERLSPMSFPLPELPAAVAPALREHGFVVLPYWLPVAFANALREDCENARSSGRLQPARVGRGAGSQHDRTLRGDATLWLDAAAAPVQAQLLALLEQIRATLNRELLFGLESVEAHYAVYPPGAGYVRHRDRFRDDDSRTLSFTCYLNPAWQAADGGALRLHRACGPLDVLPHLGTACLFLSAEIEHEVLPATRPRYSIAGWLRRRPLQGGMSV